MEITSNLLNSCKNRTNNTHNVFTQIFNSLPIWFIICTVLHTHIGEGNGTPLQYSCLENPMDGGAWQAAVHGVAESRARLSDFTFTLHFHALEKESQPTPVFLPGESQGQRSLAGCCLWGRTESDTTEVTQQQQQQHTHIHTHTHTHTHNVLLNHLIASCTYLGHLLPYTSMCISQE